MTVLTRKQHRHRLEVETIELGPEPEPEPPPENRGYPGEKPSRTNYDRAALLLERPYMIVCKSHDLREFTIGANNAAAVLRQHSDGNRCRCSVITDEHGCHEASATPIDRRPPR
jgi:hypothetical protein